MLVSVLNVACLEERVDNSEYKVVAVVSFFVGDVDGDLNPVDRNEV